MSRLITTLILALGLPLLAAQQGKGKVPQQPVNLNTASATELMQLPRVGAKTAERIVAFRKQHGGFQRIEELMNVKGLGEKSFNRLKTHLTLGPKAAPAKPGTGREVLPQASGK